MKTIGERIKYFRKKRKMTQEQLAELTGIHPVSIRKYETNKMQPQIEQIERIASTLQVNANAIIGYNGAPTRVDTVGDLMGLLMTLYRAHVLLIVSDHDEDFFVRINTNIGIIHINGFNLKLNQMSDDEVKKIFSNIK